MTEIVRYRHADIAEATALAELFRAVVGFVVAEGRRRDATGVWCDTRTVNVGSNAILAKHGFRQLCLLPNHWHGEDFILWECSPL